MENFGAFVPQTSRAVVTRQTDDSVLSCRDADSLFGESTRIVFCDSFENDKLTLLPSYLNGSPQRKLRSVFCPLD